MRDKSGKSVFKYSRVGSQIRFTEQQHSRHFTPLPVTLIFVGLSSEEGRLGAQATETANVMKAITLKAFAVLLSRGNSSPWKRVTISRNTREYYNIL